MTAGSYMRQGSRWIYDKERNFVSIESWESNGFIHGFQLGAPDLRSKDTRKWLEIHSMDSLRLLNQTHSSIIHNTSILSSTDQLPEGDGWFASKLLAEKSQEDAFGVLSADCAPVIIFSRQENKAAILHSGWKGTAKNILKHALGKFSELEQVEIGIGPAAGICCYQFEEATARVNFSSWFEEDGVYEAGNLSIKEILKLQAVEAGVEENSILVSDVCTMCDENCYSFRRQGSESGRQLSFICL